MARRRKKRIKKPPIGNGRIHLNIDPALKQWLVEYAKRKHTTITSIAVSHFVELKERDEVADVQQI